jgi:hypothetical protein
MVCLRRTAELVGYWSQARFPAVTDRVTQYNCYFADTNFDQSFATGRISIILDLQDTALVSLPSVSYVAIAARLFPSSKIPSFAPNGTLAFVSFDSTCGQFQPTNGLLCPKSTNLVSPLLLLALPPLPSPLFSLSSLLFLLLPQTASTQSIPTNVKTKTANCFPAGQI